MFKKIKIFIISTFIFITLLPIYKTQEISAYSAQCSGYWVGMVSGVNNVTLVQCVSSFDAGVTLMKSRTSTASNVATVFRGSTIVASMYATLDFSATGTSSVNSYIYAELWDGSFETRADYFNGMYGVEGPYITKKSTESSAVTIVSGLRGKVNKTYNSYTQYDIVPISVSAPKNYYVASTDGSMVHYFAYFDYQTSLRIGVAPDFMKKDGSTKYYSYDGHYFYTDFITMINDLNESTVTYSNAINKNAPWYNYYQYLPFHSTTNYTAKEMDSFFTSRGYDSIGYTQYSSSQNGQSTYPLSTQSMLYGSASYFMQMQQIYGINPMLLLTISINETGWGRSSIAIHKRNLFGMAAYDSNVGAATSYNSVQESVLDVAALLTRSYFDATTSYNYYYGPILGNKETGVNVKYASDPYWGEKAAAHYYTLDRYLGLKDYNYYTIGITNKINVNAYSSPSTASSIYNVNGVSRKIVNNAFLIVGESGNFYKVMSDNKLSSFNTWTSDGMTADYNLEDNFVYVLKSDLTVVNKQATYNSPKNSREINRIRIEYLNEYIPLEVKADTPVYLDAYFQNSVGSTTLKTGAYVTATERAYSSTGDVAYKVVYNTANGAVGWVRAEDVIESTLYYAIKHNSTHDAIGSAVYASTNTSSKVGEVKYNSLPITIIDQTTVSGTTWYYVCINATNKTFGWTAASGYRSPILHTAPEKPKPLDPEDPGFIEELEHKKDFFHLEKLSLAQDGKSLLMYGLLAIDGITNSPSTNLEYSLVLKNQNNGDTHTIELDRWTTSSEFPFNVNSLSSVKYDYSGAWFKGNVDFKDIPSGNYSASIQVKGEEYYTFVPLNNLFSIPMAQRFTNASGTGIELRTNFNLKAMPIDLFIREDGLLTNSTKPSMENAFIEYLNIGLDRNKLNIRGYAFNVGGDYSPSSDVSRIIVLENVETFERFYYDVGSITNGDYKITLRVPDNKDKTRSWFDSSMDLSLLPKGTYTINVITTAGNGLKDYGELTDPFYKKLNVTSTDSGKTYSLVLNEEIRTRIELIVE